MDSVLVWPIWVFFIVALLHKGAESGRDGVGMLEKHLLKNLSVFYRFLLEVLIDQILALDVCCVHSIYDVHEFLLDGSVPDFLNGMESLEERGLDGRGGRVGIEAIDNQEVHYAGDAAVLLDFQALLKLEEGSPTEVVDVLVPQDAIVSDGNPKVLEVKKPVSQDDPPLLVLFTKVIALSKNG